MAKLWSRKKGGLKGSPDWRLLAGGAAGGLLEAAILRDGLLTHIWLSLVGSNWNQGLKLGKLLLIKCSLSGANCERGYCLASWIVIMTTANNNLAFCKSD